MTAGSRPLRLLLPYAAALALGTAALQWLDWQRVARTASIEIIIALIAAGFLALGVWAGWRLARPQPPLPAGQAATAAGLGISPREIEVLAALARGLTTKEIARTLAISPNTVKTHTARLFEKLPAATRTEAAARGRELGILS